MMRKSGSMVMLVVVSILLISELWLPVGASPASTPKNGTFMETSGALTPVRAKNYVNITVLNGKPREVKFMDRLFSRRGWQLLCPGLTIPLVGVDFSVSYTRVVPLRLRLRFASFTWTLNSQGLVVLRNKAHTVVVHGFNGILFFDRAHALGFLPARFDFIGRAQNVTVAYP